MKIELQGDRLFVGTGGMPWKPSEEHAHARTMVLVHGAGMDHTVWLLLSRYFARHGYRLVVPDLPGHGRSDGPLIASIDGMAEHLWVVLDELEARHGLALGSVILGGHSMGALVALAAAGMRPDAVHQLLLCGACYPMPVGAPLLDAARANGQAAIDMITIYSLAYASLLGHNRLAGISVQNSARVLLEQAADGVIYNDLAACNTWAGGEDAASAWQPGHTTIIAGDSDRMTPMKGSRALASLVDADGFELIENAGHMMMSEQPEATLAAVKRALASAADD